MIVYGSGNADGNRHTHDNLPVVLAGGGGGTLTPGRYVKHGSKPMTNLFLSMADRLGLRDLDRFGDSDRPARRRVSSGGDLSTVIIDRSRTMIAAILGPAKGTR